ncbi:hypothetical protein [Bacillus sp. BP-3]|uniref:hypothetical protein n=1 Tax=Bacillus sp. BP-3 TaxID=3022773 RepID=UPI00232BF9AB|nr:hypothetical protein [Bacillus sp. BP-3]MDC2866493.1 hypothetical protein [Bacillus sp. BP-3]
MEIEKHLHSNETHDDWEAFILIYENEECERIDYGVYSDKGEALNVLNEAAEELLKHENLESIRKEIEYYMDL